MKPTLLILAAGMGSRYGGLKQMDEFGPNGETILDYSLYDAIKEGFGKVVFVIRKSFDREFRDFFKGKFEDLIDIEFVFQEIEDIPDGCSYIASRTKPWGTSHAVWAARNVINDPFVVINADDFYGRGTYHMVVEYCKLNHSKNYALIGYKLGNTITKHGTVNRGVCNTNEKSQLVGIVETLKIGFDADGRISYPSENGTHYLEHETPVSMNFWVFYPDYFEFCEKYFVQFLEEHGHKLKSEFYIPLLIEDLITKNQKEVDVLSSNEGWFGVTYQEDKPYVQENIKKLISEGKYPEKLWS